VAAGAVVVGSLVLTGTAAGTHVRPKAATPLYTSFVIAYQPCNATNANHGPPFSLGTSSNAVTGGPPFGINGTTRLNIATHDPRVMDGGPDGKAGQGSDNDDRFLEEGVFVP
jgi:hypothetical protein